MGQKRHDLPNGNFIFKNKANAKGKRTLYLRYYLNSIPVMVSSGVSIDPADWDSNRELVRTRNISHERLNSLLKKQKNVIDNRIAAYDGRLTPKVLREIMDGEHLTPAEIREKEKNKDFIEYAFDYNRLRYDLKKIAFSTYYNDNHCIEMFRAYIAKRTSEIFLPMNELTAKVIEEYKEYCLKAGNKKPSINRKLKPLFKAVKYAALNDRISSRKAHLICDSYFDLRSRQYQSHVEKDKIHYLTQQQLKEFEELQPFMSHSRTREYMDLFLFSFHACGLRFSDLMTLEWRHVNWAQGSIRKNLYKEKVAHTIPLDDVAIKILKRWKHKRYNNRFVFDLLPEDFDLGNSLALDNKRKSKNKALQLSLREVGCKLPTKPSFNLTIHVARHTFVVMALNNGMSIYALSKVLGHRSVAATEKFYAKYLYPNLAEEVLSKMNHLFCPKK